jgi:ribosome-associated protein
MITPDDIPADALTYRFMRASGPGGQHVNKVSTAVELRIDVEKTNLPGEIRQRLRQLAGRRATLDGEIVINADGSRSQARNREAALERFAALLTAAQQKPRKRIPTRPSRTAKARRVEQKTKRGRTKRLRQKPIEE